MTIALKVSGDEPNIPIADIKFKVLKYASADAGTENGGIIWNPIIMSFPDIDQSCRIQHNYIQP